MGRSLTAALLSTSFAIVCLLPHVQRLAHPSLFSDDVIRIADLQTRPLGDLLLRPFNEHVAPIFELISWTTWQLAGRRLSYAALAFTLASVVPLLLCLLALCALVCRETRSLTTGLCATVLFCLSAVHVEAIWWYSASSFTWALLATLLTWLCILGAQAADRRGTPATLWRIGGAVAAAAAPACSAIGLLAGPVGALRAGLIPGPVRRKLMRMLVPLAGTLLYLTTAGGTHYGMILRSSVERSPNSFAGLLCCLRAPADVLAMGLFGLGNGDRWLPGGLDLILTVCMLVGALSWPGLGSRRPMMLCGLATILGGYALTYGVRNVYGTHWLMEVQRYHLFPQLGFVLILAAAAQSALVRFDVRPRVSLRAATVLAVLLLVANRSLLESRLRSYRFPDQQATLCALERLDLVCREQGITRSQAVRALGPVRPRWFPHNSCALAMLPDSVEIPSLPDEAARTALKTALSLAEREALCGGMDVSQFVQAMGEPPVSETIATGRLLDGRGFAPIGAGCWRAERGPAFLDFVLADAVDRSPLRPARWLCVPGSGSAEKIDVWWSDLPGHWSEARSVHWQAASGRASKECVVPLDSLPHWTPIRSIHLRIVVRSDQPVTLEPPRFLR
jgi:hypothetical protein